MLVFLIVLFIIALDQITKWIVDTNMYLGQRITIIDQFLYITSHRNTGAAWGILSGQMWFFYIITVIVVIGLIYYIRKTPKQKFLMRLALAFMLGGAIGNFIDRVVRKEVVDFIDTYIFSYNFPIFNIADSALCIGVGLLLIQMILDERKQKEKKLHESN
ncbi:signal peptidase II [Bacillus carboniphilus]|uniref:Lipoprotein signal peptidase n=1 Tax=Bacillus carboniphilus TaxID=86663 RepID=A0ABY9K134_9BACI|nr:signal peptidase II [Bacillus carboniphilus]WLR43606.1 signal peptidase II [Bacillus carboniphilus]